MRSTLIAFSQALSDNNTEGWKLILVSAACVVMFGLPVTCVAGTTVLVLCLLGSELDKRGGQ